MLEDEGAVQESESEGTAAVEQVEQPTPDPVELQSKLDAAIKELEQEKKLRLSHEQSNSRLSREKVKTDDLVALVSDLKQEIGLMAKLQSGDIDGNQYAQKVQEVASQRQQQTDTSRVQTIRNEALMSLAETFNEAKIDPNDPEVLANIKPLVEEGDRTGSYVKAIRAAERLARTRSNVDEKEVEKRVRSQIVEESKDNPALRVSQSKGGAAGGNPHDILKRFNEGDKSITEKQVEDALNQL